MSTCKLNHSTQDVIDKVELQKSHLPEILAEGLFKILQTKPSQVLLNELFHLLKKYDLSSPNEQEIRNNRLSQLIILKGED
ncbi:group-specific protein [Bacillus sp. RG28]|uniref:Group-specific protein n=1 Tax=Gottfriedia endophytica TaxID=2820819 RepID=A0A940SH34_9BACI|nr:group-specific protein [Gottfriedia endophytica]MBP0725762.1 group-specific protein [Gottfriedia endophytica]